MWTLIAVIMLNGELRWKDYTEHYGKIDTIQECLYIAALEQSRAEIPSLAFVCTESI